MSFVAFETTYLIQADVITGMGCCGDSVKGRRNEESNILTLFRISRLKNYRLCKCLIFSDNIVLRGRYMKYRVALPDNWYDNLNYITWRRDQLGLIEVDKTKSS